MPIRFDPGWQIFGLLFAWSFGLLEGEHVHSHAAPEEHSSQQLNDHPATDDPSQPQHAPDDHAGHSH